MSTVCGHEDIMAVLHRMYDQEQLPHALLFTGKSGIGKKLVAYELAEYILQHTSINIELGSHPDIHLIKPEKSGAQIKIEQIRELMKKITLSPFSNIAHIVIIDNAEQMNLVSTNSILKTLEEPPGTVYFILITEHPDKLLPTIVSRCVKFRFCPLTDNQLRQVIMSKYSVGETQLKLAILLAEGSMENIDQIITEAEHNWRHEAMDFIRHLDEYSLTQILGFADKLSQLERAELKEWICYARICLRDIYVMHEGANQHLIYNKDLEDIILEEAHQRQWTTSQLQDKMELISNLALKLNTNADAKMLLQNFCLEWQKLNE